MDGSIQDKDIIAPSYINLENPKYIEIDNLYYGGLIVVNYYREQTDIILKTLIEKYPQVITRENLLDSIWGYDYYGDTRIVDAHIKNLRKKIKLQYIKTVKGIGYTLEKSI